VDVSQEISERMQQLPIEVRQRIIALYDNQGDAGPSDIDGYNELRRDNDDALPNYAPRCIYRFAVRVQRERMGQQKASIPTRYKSVSFKDYQTPSRDHERFREQTKRFVGEWLVGERKDRTGLLFYGPVGSGKTFMLGCIAHEFEEHGIRYVWHSAATLLEKLKDSFDDESAIDPCKFAATAPVLFLDDLGAERLTNFADDAISRLLGTRYNEMLPTFISSNLSRRDLEHRIGARTYSRLCESAIFVGPFPSHDWRRQKHGKGQGE